MKEIEGPFMTFIVEKYVPHKASLRFFKGHTQLLTLSHFSNLGDVAMPSRSIIVDV